MNSALICQLILQVQRLDRSITMAAGSNALSAAEGTALLHCIEEVTEWVDKAVSLRTSVPRVACACEREIVTADHEMTIDMDKTIRCDLSSA